MPKSPVRQAMDYALRQRAALSRYVEDGRLAIDNGAAERAIRGIALGRKNSYDCLSTVCAQRDAVIWRTMQR